MNRDLRTYFMRLDAWLDDDLCRQAIACMEDAPWTPHTYTASGSLEKVSVMGDREPDIAYVGDQSLNRALMKRFIEATRFYCVRLQFPWLAAPRNHSVVRFNRYSPDQKMIEHCDHIDSLFDGNNRGIPILSCLALLNDGFEGGELVFWKDEVIPMQAGTMIVFPSNFLFPHRVAPLLSGVRYSCVSWAW